MNPSSTPPEPEAVEIPTRLSLMARLRNYFLTGLVIAAPLTITIYIVLWLVEFVDGRVKPLIPARYNPDLYLPFTVPGVGLVLALVFITLIGFLTANLLGRTLVAYGETVVGRMPLVRTIYSGLKQIFETVLSSRASTFQEVVLVEYPRRGIWAIAFVATQAKGIVSQKIGERDGHEELVAVFLPTTPNPTSGFLLFVKRSDLIELDVTVEEGAKLVISAGLVTPEETRAKALADLARTRRKPKQQRKPEAVSGAE